MEIGLVVGYIAFALTVLLVVRMITPKKKTFDPGSLNSQAALRIIMEHPKYKRVSALGLDKPIDYENAQKFIDLFREEELIKLPVELRPVYESWLQYFEKDIKKGYQEYLNNIELKKVVDTQKAYFKKD